MNYGMIEAGSRVRTKTGKPGRVIRVEDEIAYVQLDEEPTPDGAPYDLSDLEIMPHDA
jgi:hypothetical protein